jgi:hypothetical protein
VIPEPASSVVQKQNENPAVLGVYKVESNWN